MPIQDILYPTRFRQVGVVSLVGSFVGNASSDPTSVEGDVLSVTRSGAGVYVIQLPGRGTLDIFYAAPMVVSSNAWTANVTSISEANRTVTVTVTDKATPTVQDLTSNDKLQILVVTKNSTGK